MKKGTQLLIVKNRDGYSKVQEILILINQIELLKVLLKIKNNISNNLKMKNYMFQFKNSKIKIKDQLKY